MKLHFVNGAGNHWVMDTTSPLHVLRWKHYIRHFHMAWIEL